MSKTIDRFEAMSGGLLGIYLISASRRKILFKDYGTVGKGYLHPLTVKALLNVFQEQKSRQPQIFHVGYTDIKPQLNDKIGVAGDMQSPTDLSRSTMMGQL